MLERFEKLTEEIEELSDPCNLLIDVALTKVKWYKLGWTWCIMIEYNKKGVRSEPLYYALYKDLEETLSKGPEAVLTHAKELVERNSNV